MAEIRNEITYARMTNRKKRVRITWSGRVEAENPRERCRRYEGLFVMKRRGLQ